jgi:hypothetical protein
MEKIDKLELSKAIIQSLRDLSEEVTTELLSERIDSYRFQELILKNLGLAGSASRAWTHSLRNELCF